MSSLTGLVLPFCVGWGVWRWYRRYSTRPHPISVIGLWALVGSGAFLLLLESIGVRWHVWLLALMGAGGLLLGLVSRRVAPATSHTPNAWGLLAAVVTGVQGLLVALRPATGWDFRYIWGLKAKVFALAATNDTRWLAWPPNARLHPDYPPLWPDLMAMGVRLSGSVEAVATWWQVLLLVALAAACWDNLRDVPPVIRATGAATGALAPIVLLPAYSGNADLVVAFLAAVALGALARLCQDSDHDPAALLSLSAAVAGLCLTKNEGMVLALGVTVATLWVGTQRGRVVVGGTFLLAAGYWQVFLLVHSIPREPRSVDPKAWFVAANQMLGWLWGQVNPLIWLLLLSWLLAAIALAQRRTIAVAIALGVFWCGLIAAYLSSMQGTLWHLTTSFDRVIAAPLPAAISVALASCARTRFDLPSA